MIISRESQREEFKRRYAAAGVRSAIFNKRKEMQGSQSWWSGVTGEACRVEPHRRVLAMWMNSFPEINHWRGPHDPNDLYFWLSQDRVRIESHIRRSEGNDLMLYSLSLEFNVPRVDYRVRVLRDGLTADSGPIASRQNFRRIPSLRHIRLTKDLVRSATPYLGR